MTRKRKIGIAVGVTAAIILAAAAMVAVLMLPRRALEAPSAAGRIHRDGTHGVYGNGNEHT